MKDVPAFAAGQQVVSCAAGQDVSAGPAIDLVNPIATKQPVTTVESQQLVVAVFADKCVAAA